MVGNSPVMYEVFEQIRRFATCDMPVLITGESGTGKELVARAIHNRSSRSTGQFVAINCAAVPATLIASELFGYEKGAFTGANSRKRGQIELAHRGTLLLDEIGDMPIELQGHLLRFLQEGEIVRVGGHEPIKVDVRVIAATHVRVQEAINTGRLREDLYYRLNVLNIHMPPLRERHGDIEVLAAYFLHQIARDLGRDVRAFSPDAVSALEAHDWPGNVREFIATIRRAVVLSDSECVQRADLRICAARSTIQLSAPSLARPAPGSDAERDMLRNALQRHGFNVTRTARELKISRVTLYRMLARNCLTLRHDCVAQDQSANTIPDAGSANGLLSC
jgi:transcriptional regulator with PAS, ATPase and Fis domain